MEIATGYVGLSSFPQSSFPPLAYGTLLRRSDPDLNDRIGLDDE
jgi:hypothetical protein